MPSQIQLSISAQGASDDEISAITKDVAAWINEAAPQCEVEQQTEAGPEGAKGIIDILGSLGVSFLEHGALASLINCLTVYIKERRREITITLKTPAGGSVELKAGGIGPREIDDMILRLSEMTGPKARKHA